MLAAWSPGSIAAATATSAEQTRLFEAGRDSFAQRDFQAALRNYEAAAAAGLQGAAIDFNIGVAAYRAGEFAKAHAAFLRAAESPEMRALAHYNLGLVDQARGDRKAARAWFRRVQQQAEDPKLLALAERQLGGTDSERWQWSGYASAALGHDDNVSLSSDADTLQVSGQDDQFAEAQLGLSARLSSNWRLEAGLDHLDYFDLNEFDLLSGHGAARYRFNRGDWIHELRGQVTHTRLDGDAFETRRALSLQSSHPLGKDWQFRARYRFSHLDGLGGYSRLDGTRHEAQARFARSIRSAYFSVAYELELNDQRARSLASDRHELLLFLEQPLSDSWTVELDGSLLRSGYDDGTSDTTTQLGVRLAHKLAERWRIVGDYTHSRNDSDRALLDYSANQLSIGAEFQF